MTAKKSAAKKAAPPAATRPAPEPIEDEPIDGEALVDEPDVTEDDVPDELVFSSYKEPVPEEELSAEEIELEKPIPIKIDQFRFQLERPSDSALIQLGAQMSAALRSDSWAEQLNSMNAIVDISIDDAGRSYLFARTRAKGNTYDDGLVGKLAKAVLDKWAPSVQQDPPMNRAQKRQAERAKK